MNSKPLIAFFDFCDTLINGQTVSLFFNYLDQLEKKNYLHFRRIIRNKINPYNSSQGAVYKNYLLKNYYFQNHKQLDNIIKNFLTEIIFPRENKKVLAEMEKLQKNKITIAIVSNSFDIIVQPFAKKYGVDYVISTHVDFADHKKYLQIIGSECTDLAKVTKIKQQINLTKFDLVNSLAYGDSIHDLPMFNLVGRSVVVSTVKPSWVPVNSKLLCP